MGEGERWIDVNAPEGRWVQASRLEAAESALRELVEICEAKGGSGPALDEARSILEGSKPIPDMFRMSRSFPEGRIEGSNE